jgi:hypothetical protein
MAASGERLNSRSRHLAFLWLSPVFPLFPVVPRRVGIGEKCQRKDPLTFAGGGLQEWALRGSNPRPHGCDTSEPLSQEQPETPVAPTPSEACTTACTNSPKTTNASDLDKLMPMLLTLSKADRAALVAKLLCN